MLREHGDSCLASTRTIPAPSFHVHAIADGVVAYARANNAASCPVQRPGCDLDTTGLGLTVILDHGNGVYSLYAHMAQDAATNRCLPEEAFRNGASMKVKLGQHVKAGDVIGYLGQLGPGVNEGDQPSGNAAATEHGAQLHFELFRAPVGKRSTTSIGAIVGASERGKIDPTTFLSRFYK